MKSLLTLQWVYSVSWLWQKSGSRSTHRPSTQLTEHSAACWVTPLPFSHGIAPIPALIFRRLRSCEKLHTNRQEKKKIMVVLNSFLHKHKIEWLFIPPFDFVYGNILSRHPSIFFFLYLKCSYILGSAPSSNFFYLKSSLLGHKPPNQGSQTQAWRCWSTLETLDIQLKTTVDWWCQQN